ncbi:MAG: YfhO family protein, partial [Nitrospinota bacterium]
NPQKYAILEEQPDFHFHIPSDERVEGEVLITDYKNEMVKIIADIQGNGLLILGDTWFPGWKAFVDGIERKIYRVNYIQRGVFLEHGKHNIEFVYTPASYTVGKFITLFTLLSSGVIFISIYLKSR